MKKLLTLLLVSVALSSCKKELSNVYQIDPVYVEQSGKKSNLKSDLQFVSIAYSDLFGKQISANELNVLLGGYNSVGDKALVIDLILRNMLQEPGILKATQAEMQADPEAFIEESFQRFLVRHPNELERWFFTDLIQKDPALLPEDLYYSLMSAEEYRYY